MSVQVRHLIALGYGIVCHAMFFAGIITMIAMMYFGMSRSVGMLSPPLSLLANGMLLAQFALLHSFLLSKGGRTVLARLAPAGFGGDLASPSRPPRPCCCLQAGHPRGLSGGRRGECR